MRYASAAAFRSALEAQVRLRSQRDGSSIVRLRKAITFERLLARLLVVAPERWMLKGALALDFRLGVHARATMDMDLGRYDDAETATDDLLAAQEHDLGDYFAFSVERTDRLDALREATAGVRWRLGDNSVVDASRRGAGGGGAVGPRHSGITGKQAPQLSHGRRRPRGRYC